MTSSTIPKPLFPRSDVQPIECATWCNFHHGHADALFPEDQVCFSQPMSIPLSLQPVDGDDGRELATLEVFVERAFGRASAIGVDCEDKRVCDLTPTEARHLIEALTEALREEALPAVQS